MLSFLSRIVQAIGQPYARLIFPVAYTEEVRYTVWLYEHREEAPQC